MPIKGLTDRGLSFPEIGQIRKGAKKTENRPGADLTFFRVEFDEQEQKAAQAFAAVYSDKPSYIRIILPFNEIERMWDAWYEAYTAGRMIARSDGEYIVYMLDDKGDVVVQKGVDASGNKVPHPANGIAGHDYKGKPVQFKASGRLKVIIPELSRAAYLTVMTTSVHDIANISAQLGAFKELNGGQLAGIPFILRRRPKKISTPGENGQRVRRVKSLISIEADPQWVKAKLGEIKTLAMPEDTLLLPDAIEDMSEYEPDEDEVEAFVTEIQDDWNADIAAEEEAEPPIKQSADLMGTKAVKREPDVPVITPQFLLDEQIVKNKKEADYMIALLMIDGAAVDEGKARIKLFNAWRKVFPGQNDAARKQAAEKAIAGEQP